jgi:diaminopimelate epimerase
MAAAPRNPASLLRFTKMHGAGNDFVVLDLRDGSPPPSPALSRALADRHAGVGCDQILTIEAPRSAGAVAAYGIWNADGTPARQCGNGARCIAAWLVRDGAAQGACFVLDSPAGSHEVERLDDGRFRIAMGVPQFAPQAIPLAGFNDAQDEYALDVVLPQGRGEPQAGSVRFGAVSMGNPHALVEVDDIARAPVATLGPALQAHAAFPDSVNVGFVEVDARDRIRLRVYERGAGETLACGSGACAAAAILMRRGRIDRDVVVALPGGELRIGWRDDNAPITMTGPATFVFEGELSP